MQNTTKAATVSQFSLNINDKLECWINYQVEDKSRKHEYKWKHTTHSRKRAAQRGINYKILLLAIEYGEVIQKQGLTYHVVQRNSLPDYLNNRTKDKLNNIVVVTSNYGQEIITCYKASNAIKHINRKRKRLN